MSLINVLLKLAILLLDMLETYDSLNIPRLNELGQMERTVRDSKEQAPDQKQTTRRRRVGGGKRRTAVRTALTTMLVWNIFQKLEPVCDNTLAWFVPFYDSIKTLFLVWLLFTRSFGAAILMTRIIVPIVRPYEGVLAGVLQLAISLQDWTIAAYFALASQAMQRLGLSSTIEAVAVKDEDGQQTSLKRSVSSASKPPSVGPSSDNNDGGGTVNGAYDSASQPKVIRKKASLSTLRPAKERRAPLNTQVTKARKVLQDLPVPTHQPDKPLTNGHRLDMAAPVLPPIRSSQQPSRPIEPGPPPSSPAVLKNFAFIPGQTPPQVRPSIISPTPQFPGGFGASLSNHSQPARIPVTSSMPPLTASRSPTHLTPAILPTRPPPADDDNQVVPPPALHSKASNATLRSRKKANDAFKSSTRVATNGIALSLATKKRMRNETADTLTTAEADTQSPARKKPKADSNASSESTARSPLAAKRAVKRGATASTQRSSQLKKNAPSTSKISSIATTESQLGASPPKPRLSRSRTKQNIAE